MRTTIPVAAILVLAVAAIALADVPPAHLPEGWGADLDAGAGPDLGFLFEVTFMKIDVAFVDAYTAPAEDMALAAMRAVGERNSQREDAVVDHLLAADRIVFRFTLRRDGHGDRFHSGTRTNLEAARAADMIDDAELEAVWAGYNKAMDDLGERESAKGDQLIYAVDPDGVRMGYLDVAGTILFDVRHDGDAWARAIKGSFLAPESRFREKLARSAWERGE